MGKVLHLFRAPKRRAVMEELPAVQVIENSGLEGCAHARPNGMRQVLLVDIQTLREMDLAPGITRENITTEGLDVNGLELGQKLKVGEVELVVSVVCEPCEQIEALRKGLLEAMVGKRGMLCRVVNGGTVKAGDEINLI